MRQPLPRPSAALHRAAAAALAALAVHTATQDAAAAALGQLSVMTFNIKSAAVELGFDQHASWDYLWNNDNDRRARVVAVMNDSGADIIGVQEMRGGQLDYLDDRLSRYAYYGASRDTGTTAGNGERVGIFYDKQRFELLVSGEFWLSETPDAPGTTFAGNGGDLNNPRMATWVTLRDRSLEAEYFVLNTHWSLDSEARRLSGLLIRDQLVELAAGRPILAMGDFNETAAGQGCAALVRPRNPGEVALANAYVQSGAPSGKTFHGYNGGVDGSPIDFVFASSTDFVGVDGEIIRTTVDGYYPSDHYPVRVVLDVLSGRAPGDYDSDGRIDGSDYLLWQRTYGDAATPGSGADGNADARVTAADLNVWKAGYGATPAGAAQAIAVAEPATAALAFVSACGVLAGRSPLRPRSLADQTTVRRAASAAIRSCSTSSEQSLKPPILSPQAMRTAKFIGAFNCACGAADDVVRPRPPAVSRQQGLAPICNS